MATAPNTMPVAFTLYGKISSNPRKHDTTLVTLEPAGPSPT